MQHEEIINFILESNKIEGIIRDIYPYEIQEFKRFMALEKITVDDLERFVHVFQPGAKLRDKFGLNVRIGTYFPPSGGPFIRSTLQTILDNQEDAYITHIKYEQLHPFTDGNGRSGRMLWAWKMKDISLGFLHKFYYQALDYHSKKEKL